MYMVSSSMRYILLVFDAIPHELLPDNIRKERFTLIVSIIHQFDIDSACRRLSIA